MVLLIHHGEDFRDSAFVIGARALPALNANQRTGISVTGRREEAFPALAVFRPRFGPQIHEFLVEREGSVRIQLPDMVFLVVKSDRAFVEHAVRPDDKRVWTRGITGVVRTDFVVDGESW